MCPQIATDSSETPHVEMAALIVLALRFPFLQASLARHPRLTESRALCPGGPLPCGHGCGNPRSYQSVVDYLVFKAASAQRPLGQLGMRQNSRSL